MRWEHSDAVDAKVEDDAEQWQCQDCQAIQTAAKGHLFEKQPWQGAFDDR